MGCAYSPAVTQEGMVPQLGRSLISPSTVAPPPPNRLTQVDIGDGAPAPERPAPDCMKIFREFGTQAGISQRAAFLFAGSRREPIFGHLHPRLAGLYVWCYEQGVGSVLFDNSGISFGVYG